MPKIGFDLDGVILDVAVPICELAMKRYNLKIDPKTLTHYGIKQVFNISDEEEEQVLRELLCKEMLIESPPIYNSIKTLARFGSSNKIIVITARKNSLDVKEWIERHLLGVRKSNIEVYYGHSKEKGKIARDLNLTHFIDDYYPNLIDIANHGIIPVLYLQPWNRYGAVMSRRMTKLVRTVSDWNQLDRFLN